MQYQTKCTYQEPAFAIPRIDHLITNLSNGPKIMQRSCAVRYADKKAQAPDSRKSKINTVGVDVCTTLRNNMTNLDDLFNSRKYHARTIKSPRVCTNVTALVVMDTKNAFFFKSVRVLMMNYFGFAYLVGLISENVQSSHECGCRHYQES